MFNLAIDFTAVECLKVLINYYNLKIKKKENVSLDMVKLFIRSLFKVGSSKIQDLILT